MPRICALIALVFCCATYLYGDPADDARRIERFHNQLQTVGTGNATSIWVLLKDGESLKGTIDYLSPTEVGIRDQFGHLRPVPLKGIVEFTAQNQSTHVKAASTARWKHAARLFWRRLTRMGFDGLTQPHDAEALL